MNILEMKNFHFSYPLQERETLCGVDMAIEEGKFYVICGRSGSGKSTLLRHFKQALMPQGERTGEIIYCGSRLEELLAERQCSEIGYVFQNPETQPVTDKVWHELAFGLESLGYDNETIHLRVAEMAAYFGIQNWFLKNVSELSGGQKQLLNLASVMVMHPKVLLLDEPTSQLDPIAASEFLHTVHRINKELGVTILLTEHRLEEVLSLADSVFVMEEGKVIAAGKADEVGEKLRRMNHGMFLSMPSPMRIYAETRSKRECPYTVAMGRVWLSEELAAVGRKVKNGLEKSEVLQKNAEKRHKGSLEEQIPSSQEEILCVKEIWFRYERDLPDVVQGLSFTVRRGEIFALMGGNGAGKSTALRLISRLLTPDRGRIYLAGKALSNYTKKELYGGMLGILPQNPTAVFAKKTVIEELEEMLSLKRETTVEKKGYKTKNQELQENAKLLSMIDFLEIRNLLERHPYDLSGGEQQKVALAKVLLQEPRLLLLDEPTKGLDAYFKRELGQLLCDLSQQGVTIILVSHDIEFCAEYASRAGLFFEGELTGIKETGEFFAGNHFYTTAVNRMARSFFPNAVTVEEVAEALRQNGIAMREIKEKSDIVCAEADILYAKTEETVDEADVVRAEMLEDVAKMEHSTEKNKTTPGFERKQRAFTQRLVVLAVLIALAVAGRAAFFMMPSVKPMAAVTIISAVSLGPWQGFLVGALSMLTSNMLFGQGPWTIWQMLAMGLVGLFAGFIFYRRKKLWKRYFLCAYGFVSVILCYGMLMNTASLFMASYELNAQNLKAIYLSGLPVDLVHAASTVLFLAILGRPMLEQLERVKKKI